MVKFTKLTLLALDHSSEEIDALFALLPADTFSTHRARTWVDASRAVARNNTDIVVYSEERSHEDGVEFIEWLETEHPGVLQIPIVDRDNGAGLGDFLLRPLQADQVMQTILRCLEKRDAIRENHSLREIFRQTVKGFARSLEAKDSYTAGHSGRVKLFTSMIADGYRLHGFKRDLLLEAALVHDIGKICVDLSALNNAGKLTPQEIELFRSHPTKGKELLDPIPFMAQVVPMVYHHHESLDGKGYPLGLGGKEIPFGARVIAVADSYDAMTSHRVYRRALGHEAAISELQRFAGIQFDSEIVDVFLREVGKHLHDEPLLQLLGEPAK